MLNTAWRLARRRRNPERGQSLVEFALVFPIFMLLIIGLVEFAVMFSVMLNVNYASRDAALLAAEVGAVPYGDCIILQTLDTALEGPTHLSEIKEVRIFWADTNGVEKTGGKANVYAYGGVGTTCGLPDGTTLTVPYTATALNYPTNTRCTTLAGCGLLHPVPDTIGVSIEFHHNWLTPLPNLVTLPVNGITFTRSNTMQMEPVL